MKRTFITRTVLAMTLAVSALASDVTIVTSEAHAGNHFTPPGIQPCFNPGGCNNPPVGGGGIIMPPPPPGPGGGGGGGGFGGGLGAGIGLGVGLGIVNALRPPQVIYQQQPVYVQPVPQAVPVGLSPHDQFCLGKYKSYNIQTKHYLSFSGSYKLCVSPYM